MHVTYTPKAQFFVRFALRWAFFELPANFRKSALNDPKWPWYVQCQKYQHACYIHPQGPICRPFRSTMSLFWVTAQNTNMDATRTPGAQIFVRFRLRRAVFICNRNLYVVCLPSSVRRPSMLQLSLNLMHGFLSNFGCCIHWAIRSDVFWIFFKKNLGDFLTIFFVFVNMGPMGAKIQNGTPPTNRSQKFSNFSWISFPVVLTKLRLEFLKFWKLKF